MFTGIIHGQGRIIDVGAEQDSGVTPITAALSETLLDRDGLPEHGASIAVNGCCLTVARRDPAEGSVGFDVIRQTRGLTTLDELAPGDGVNLELSVTPETKLDGHVVQGHVEGLGEVLAVTSDASWRARIRAPLDLMPAIVPKGSIAVHGVSLTLAEVDPEDAWFEIALIPTTLNLTTLGGLRPGDRVHLETDILARTAVHWLTHFGGSVGGR